MKIALTGSSSTGKTTLATKLMGIPSFCSVVHECVSEDARSLLESMGHQNMDNMSSGDLRDFQERYLKQKIANERGRAAFLVDRSYVDVAAYWIVRDSPHVSERERDEYVELCRPLASAYDLHIHFPYGVIPFRSDGYRSEDQDFHKRIAEQIKVLLRDWEIRVISLHSSTIDERVQEVLSAISTNRGPENP